MFAVRVDMDYGQQLAVILQPAPHAGEIRTSNHNDSHLHPFVDDGEIKSLENLEQVANRPKKHLSTVLVADRRWESDRVQG